MKSKLHLNLTNLLAAAKEQAARHPRRRRSGLEGLLRAAVRVMGPHAREAFWESPEVQELLGGAA